MSRQLTSGVLGRRKKVPIPVDGLFQWFTPESIIDTNGLCRKWEDISGNNYHAEDLFHTNDSDVPDVVQNGINGLRGLDFEKDAVLSNETQQALNGLTSLKGITMIAVNNINATGGIQCLWGCYVNNSNVSGRARLENGRTTNRYSVGGRRLDSDSFVSRPGTSSLTLSPTIQTGLIEYENAQAYLYLNNIFDNNTTSFQTAGVSDDKSSDLIHIGAGSNKNVKDQLFKGIISEVIIYTRAITEQERNEIHEYLSNKYNI